MTKRKIVVGIIFILFVITFLIGCTEQETNNKKYDADNDDDLGTTLFHPYSVSLVETDLIEFDKLSEDFQNESYNITNMTGNNQVWTIRNGYFATFACNTSRLTESIIRLESKELALENINLIKPFLLLKNEIEESLTMSPIGDSSFLLKGSKVVGGNDIDVYVIYFSLNDIIVALHGFGSEQQELISYATRIETRIYDNIQSL